MIYKNKETGREVDTFDCSDRRCDNCPVGKKYPEEGFMNCGDYVRAHEEEALALLGYYPVEEEKPELEKKPRFRPEDWPGQVFMVCEGLPEKKYFMAFLVKNGLVEERTARKYYEEWLKDCDPEKYGFDWKETALIGIENPLWNLIYFSDFDWSQEPDQEKKPEPVKQEEDKQVIRCTLVLTETEVAHLLQASMNDGMTGADYLVKLLQNDIVCKKTWR